MTKKKIAKSKKRVSKPKVLNWDESDDATSEKREATLAHGDTTRLYTRQWVDIKYYEGYEKGFRDCFEFVKPKQTWPIYVAAALSFWIGFIIRSLLQ